MSKHPVTQDNPLIYPPALPHDAPPLDRIKTEHFLPAVYFAIDAARNEIAAIKSNTAAPDFANTIEALEFSGKLLNRVGGIFGHFSSVQLSDEIRAIEDEFDLACVQFGNDVSLDEDLFARIKAVYDQKDNLKLSAEQKKLLEETYKGFVRGGALLDAEGKKELREINERMSELSTAFKNNSVQAVAAYQKVIDQESDLAGVPDDIKSVYREFAEKAGLTDKWLVKLSPPPIYIMEYAENRALREEIYRANTSVGWQGQFDNSANILEIVQLRHRRAQLMNFDTHADFVLDDRMAKTPETVLDFLRKNEMIYKPAAEAYLQKVKDYAQKTDGLTDLQPWDFSFYSRRLKEETFSLNLEDMRPYFDLEKVLDGLRIHAEKLFDIKMTETKGVYPVNHPDVKVYEVHDNKTGEIVGLFYADYYARSGEKRGGAWMNTLRNRGLEDGENKFPFVLNVCNFAKPTQGKPTLLSIDEVRTVFHEFGHGLHALMAKGDYASLTGTNVKWDFVELPSQLQENWAKEKEVLDTFARHHKTGATLPAEMIRKMNEMENFDAGYAGLRQTFMALLDMEWHTQDPAMIKSVEALEDKIIAETWLFPRVAGPVSTNFGHIFAGGYSAGYYSYKWAEVLEADVYEVFTTKGLYERSNAERLCETIYAKGGTEDPAELFRQMRGRDPDPEALFRREGLLPPPVSGKSHTPPPPHP